MLPVASGPVNAVGTPLHSQPPPRHGAEDHPGEERDLHDHQRPEDRRGKIAHPEIPRLAFGIVAQLGFHRDAVHLDAARRPGRPPVLALERGIELALQSCERALIAGDDRQRIVLGIEIARLQPPTEPRDQRGEVFHAAILPVASTVARLPLSVHSAGGQERMTGRPLLDDGMCGCLARDREKWEPVWQRVAGADQPAACAQVRLVDQRMTGPIPGLAQAYNLWFSNYRNTRRGDVWQRPPRPQSRFSTVPWSPGPPLPSCTGSAE